MENSNSDVLKKVVIVHRHGARGPSSGSLKPFNNDFNKNNTGTPYSQWATHEVDALTSVGREQMSILGKWLATVYNNKFPIPIKESFSVHKWNSSKIDRVIESGAHFWKGISEITGITVPLTPAPHKDPDSIFRVWSSHPEYLKAVAEMKQSQMFQSKAEKHLSSLKQLYDKFNLDPNTSPAIMLSNMTYFKELVDCEMYHPDKKALLNKLTEDDIEIIDKLSRWVWEKRFFMREHRWTIGGNIVKSVLEDLEQKEHNLIVYSSHDYSILAMLAALGFDRYMTKPLGYGAFVVFELLETPEGKEYVKFRLNAHPFEKNNEPVTEVQFSPEKLQLVFEELDSKGFLLEDLKNFIMKQETSVE